MHTPLRRAHPAVVVLLLVVAALSALAVPAAAAAAPAATPRTTDLVIGFRPGAGAAARSRALTSAGLDAATSRTAADAKRGIAALDAVVVPVATSTAASIRRSLLRRADVAYVEADHVAHAYGLGASDPRVIADASAARAADADAQLAAETAASGLAAQWSPNDPSLVEQWALTAIGAPDAWEQTRGTGVTIAVLDTGVDYIHPDLRGRVDLGRDFVDGDNDPMDVQGHGTHVAGTAAASTDNAEGIAGVAPSARILAVRVLDAKGAGEYSVVADGIVYAVGKGAKVINLSLGGPEQSSLLKSAVAYAAARGVLVTCASGNESAASIGYPASYDGCTSVGATDPDDAHADFSNRGPGLDLTAPGVQILSSTMDGGYEAWDGTSMATPFVSGLAALLYSQGLHRRAVVDTMVATAHDLGPAGVDPEFGAGRIDAAAATLAASRTPRAAPDTVAPSVSAVELLAPRRAAKTTYKDAWKVTKRSSWARVGTTGFAGRYQWSRTSTHGATRVVATFQMRGGIVYRRTTTEKKVRTATRAGAVLTQLRVTAADDTGVDRVALEIDGRTQSVDWAGADGWLLEAPCAAGKHTVVVRAFDAADNAAESRSVRTIAC